MKHLILAAAFTLIAAPAFAGGGAEALDTHNALKAKTFTDTQAGSYARSYDADSATRRQSALRFAACRTIIDPIRSP